MLVRRHSAIRIPALLTVLSVSLAACSGDTPTAAAPATHPSHFTVTPDGGRTASAATVNESQLWPTLAQRRVFPVAGSLQRATAPSVAATINSPYDLTTSGGPVLTGGTNWSLYVNCDGSSVSCWGSNGLSPSDFLKDLNRSRMISLLDQYVGTPAQRQWKFDSLMVTDPNIPLNGNLIMQTEILNILFQAVQVTGQSGYKNMYHVFLPEGVDVCLYPGRCYSPDLPSSFYFCAYHGAVTFNDGTHVIYSVEPYQAVHGCQNPNGLPHGAVDATASTLSHEFFEASTDPDLNAWRNATTGMEIGDLCFVFEYDEQIATHHYQIQTEYSNLLHACADNAR